jgi:hypothetical protein
MVFVAPANSAGEGSISRFKVVTLAILWLFSKRGLCLASLAKGHCPSRFMCLRMALTLGRLVGTARSSKKRATGRVQHEDRLIPV